MPAMVTLDDYGSDLLLALTCVVGAGVLIAATLGLALAAHSSRWRTARARCATAGHAVVRFGLRRFT